MKLGLGLDLYRGASLEMPVASVQLAERLGYHSVWTAEAYGADALSPLAYLAACTRRIKLGTAVVQIDARTPAATAMHAMTIDALAGAGRTIIGLGVSGPQVVEGWHGASWGSPTAKLRDYVAIMGSDTHNFHAEAMARRGWPEACERIVELWRAGRRDEAVAAVPDDYVDSHALVGPRDRIRSRWPAAVPAGLTGVMIRCNTDEGLALVAELAGLGDGEGDADG